MGVKGRIPSGLPTFDEVVGGYLIGRAICFYGRKATFKTHLAVYHATLQVLKYNPKILTEPDKWKVIVVSGDRSVDYEKFEDLAERHGVKPTELWKAVVILDANSWEELRDIVCKGLVQLYKNKGIKFGLLAIDPINNWYRKDVLRADKRQILQISRGLQGDLEEMWSKLFYFAEQCKCPITVTAWKKNIDESEGIPEPEREIYGGIAMAYYPQVLVRLRTVMRNPKVVEALITKNRCGPEWVKFKLTVDEKGVREVGQQ